MFARFSLLSAVLALLLLWGCGSSPEPESTEPPPAAPEQSAKVVEPEPTPEPELEPTPAPAPKKVAPMVPKAKPKPKNPVIVIETNKGVMRAELYAAKAPVTVKNFLTYVDDKFFDGTIFHRVIQDFMIQGGGFTPKMQKKETRAPIQNEADNGLKNLPGTLAMARTRDPHSATAQFFINTTGKEHLNHRDKSPNGWGYAVFGKLVGGTDVLHSIAAVEISPGDVPVEPVIIKSIRRAE